MHRRESHAKRLGYYTVFRMVQLKRVWACYLLRWLCIGRWELLRCRPRDWDRQRGRQRGRQSLPELPRAPQTSPELTRATQSLPRPPRAPPPELLPELPKAPLSFPNLPSRTSQSYPKFDTAPQSLPPLRTTHPEPPSLTDPAVASKHSSPWCSRGCSRGCRPVCSQGCSPTCHLVCNLGYKWAEA